MKNSKFIKITVLFLFCVCLFCSCSKNIDKIDSKAAGISQSSSESRLGSSGQTSSKTQRSSKSNLKNDSSESDPDKCIEVTCVDTSYSKSIFSQDKLFTHNSMGYQSEYSDFFVTSLVIDNHQELVGHSQDDKVSYSETCDEILNNQRLYITYVSEYYDKESTGYENIPQYGILFMSTKDYNPILSKVTYIDYDVSDKLPKECWKANFEKKITEEYNFRRYIGGYSATINYSNCGGVDNRAAPVIIRESWSFSYDGHNYDIVTACNLYCVNDEVDLIYKDKEYEKSDFEKSGGLLYLITLIFIDDTLLNTGRGWGPGIQSISKEEFSFPEDYDSALAGYSVYQYDKEGNVKLYPLYLLVDYSYRDFRKWSTFLFADIDGDGKGEIIKYDAYDNFFYYARGYTLGGSNFVWDKFPYPIKTPIPKEILKHTS